MERFLTEPPSQTMAKFLTDTLKLSTRLAPRLTRISTTPTHAFCSHTLQSTSLLMQGEARTSVPTSQRRGAKSYAPLRDAAGLSLINLGGSASSRVAESLASARASRALHI